MVCNQNYASIRDDGNDGGGGRTDIKNYNHTRSPRQSVTSPPLLVVTIHKTIRSAAQPRANTETDYHARHAIECVLACLRPQCQRNARLIVRLCSVMSTAAAAAATDDDDSDDVHADCITKRGQQAEGPT